MVFISKRPRRRAVHRGKLTASELVFLYNKNKCYTKYGIPTQSTNLMTNSFLTEHLILEITKGRWIFCKPRKESRKPKLNNFLPSIVFISLLKFEQVTLCSKITQYSINNAYYPAKNKEQKFEKKWVMFCSLVIFI